MYQSQNASMNNLFRVWDICWRTCYSCTLPPHWCSTPGASALRTALSTTRRLPSLPLANYLESECTAAPQADVQKKQCEHMLMPSHLAKYFCEMTEIFPAFPWNLFLHRVLFFTVQALEHEKPVIVIACHNSCIVKWSLWHYWYDICILNS